jgi:hypothetical protein
MTKLLHLIALIGVILCSSPSLANECWLKYDDFEDGFFYWQKDVKPYTKGDKWYLVNSVIPANGSQSKDFSRSGDYSLKIYMDWDQAKKISAGTYRRCEYYWYEQPQKFYFGDEIWFAFSVYIPNDFKAPDYAYWLCQLMQDWGCRSNKIAGPAGGIRITTSGYIQYFYQYGADYAECPTSKVQRSINLGLAVPGTWHDIVIHSKVEHQPIGFVYVWFDGNLIVNEPVTATCFYETSSWAKYIYLKLGLYTWAWGSMYSGDQRPDPDYIVHYFDSVKLGSGSCTYEKIATDKDQETLQAPKKPFLTIKETSIP